MPITGTPEQALRSLPVVRVGFVVRNPDGTWVRDGQATNAMRRMCRAAGLAARQWHALRHTFGTHLALINANAYRLQAWLGHARLEETMLYLHVAAAHARSLPPQVVAAGAGETDPDIRALLMLGARVTLSHSACTKGWELRAPRRGNSVATKVRLLSN